MSVRAARLLGILESLRGRRQPVCAQVLSDRHQVSLRTIYRDIASLRAQGAPIEGEPGVGYVLGPGYMLPPLSFSQDELEAVVLGMRWVEKQGDPDLALAAQRSLARILATLSPQSRIAVQTCGLLVPSGCAPTNEPWLASLRQAIRQEHAMRMEYRDLKDRVTTRKIWPFLLLFFQNSRLLAAWCELRQDFRNFRADRVIELVDLQERYPQRRHTLIKRWRARERRAEEERTRDPRLPSGQESEG